jgi:hypothetical protein
LRRTRLSSAVRALGCRRAFSSKEEKPREKNHFLGKMEAATRHRGKNQPQKLASAKKQKGLVGVPQLR